jgi:hypothetical protein
LLPAALGEAFARVALANVEREYPRHIGHLLTRAGEDLSPRKVHPAFYGSYDWHSAVHMHWLLARVLRLFPQTKDIIPVLDRHLAAGPLGAELAYFHSAAGRTFERPYGWAWLLELQAELLKLGNARWSDAVQPLAAELAQRMARFVDGAPYPIRAGSHGNTAFACVLALDYARIANHQSLEESIKAAAMRWYRADRADPKQAHLDGLALSRAWCFARLGREKEAQRHLAAAMPHVVGGDYAGEHWLASFAALALGDGPTAEARKIP